MNTVDFAQELHGNFTKRERTRLAYELVEGAMLYLQSGWFSKVCSCSIFRYEDSRLRTSYTMRINNLHHLKHVDPEMGQPCLLSLWCRGELRGMSLRRLGVLLFEIAIGKPVLDAGFNKRYVGVQINFDTGANEPGDAHAEQKREILHRVCRESSEDYKDAVEYCLRQGVDTQVLNRLDLESFYDNVVHL